MTSRESLLRKPIYWFDHEQNEIFRQVTYYMEREGINKTELAKRLNVSKGYISQILNGDFNYTLRKLIDLSMAIGLVPEIKYTPIADVIKADAEKKTNLLEEKIEISYFKGNGIQVISSSFGDGLSTTPSTNMKMIFTENTQESYPPLELAS